MSFTMPNTIVNGQSRDARPVQANFAAITAALQNDYVRTDGSRSVDAPLSVQTPTLPGHAATKGYADALIPPGVILDYTDGQVPDGWIIPMGQMVNKSENPVLWGKYQNKFGVSTSTQFWLPDLRGLFVVSAGGEAWNDTIGEKGGSKDAVVVQHEHSVDPPATNTTGDTHSHTYSALVSQGSGFTLGSGTFGGWTQTTGADTHQHSLNIAPFDSDPSGVSGTNKNLPPYIVLAKILKLG